MRTKILYVITKSNFGGAQRYVYDLARSLPSDAYDVAVVFGFAPEGKAGRLSRLLIDADIRTIVIPELGRDIQFMTDVRALSALVGVFTEEKPDVVHLNSSKAGGLGALAARFSGVPHIVFTSHGLPYDEARSLASRLLLKILTWFTIMLSHHTIMVSKDSLDRARALPFVFSKLSLIYNGIDAPEFERPHEARKALFSIDPTLPDTPFIGTIVELHANKDLITAIDAVALTQAHFVIIGDGEKRTELEAYAHIKGVGDRVHFLGFVPDAARYLRAFEVFLLSSIKEGLPYVLIEAGAAHVPIVAIDIPGVRDIVLPEFTGLTPARDPHEIAQALERVMHDAALRASLTKNMALRVREVFSLLPMREKTIALYHIPF